MYKLMCRFVTTTKQKKKIKDPNLDTPCPAGIPCKKRFAMQRENKLRPRVTCCVSVNNCRGRPTGFRCHLNGVVTAHTFKWKFVDHFSDSVRFYAMGSKNVAYTVRKICLLMLSLYEYLSMSKEFM